MTLKITKDKLEGLIIKEGNEAKLSDIILPIVLSGQYDSYIKLNEETLDKFKTKIIDYSTKKNLSFVDAVYNINLVREYNKKQPIII